MNDYDFFNKLSCNLEDYLPEEILRDKTIVQRILNILHGENPNLNFNMLSILRAWCRKMEIRIRIENDNRIKIKSDVCLRNAISPFCLQFAIGVSEFFKKNDLLPLSCITCHELIALAHASTPSLIIDRAMEHINNKNVMIPLLELIANSEKKLKNLPIFDPSIIFNHPSLHKQLLDLSSDEDVRKFQTLKNIFDEIQQINDGKLDIKRDLIQYCKMCKVINRAPHEIFASHPQPQVRKYFYQYALLNKIDITQFFDVLICCGIFDPIVKNIALKILCKQIDALNNIVISHRQIAHLQCITFRKNSKILNKICKFINASDDFTSLCSLLRFLYHKEDWINQQAYNFLSDILPFKLNIDLNEQPFEDHYVKKYQWYLKNFKEVVKNPLAETLFDTVLSDDQADFIKDIAANKLIDIILDPSQEINKYLPRLRKLSFSRFPKLLHALSIRDGEWKISSCEQVYQLLSSITFENSMDLLPILSRIIFQPLLIYEGNQSSLLKFPRFVEENYNIKGNGGFIDITLYKPINDADFSEILTDWVHFKPSCNKPIKDGVNIPDLISFCLCDHLLATDLLCQLDDEESAMSKLITVAPPPQIIYLLLISVLSAKIPSKAASKLCELYIDQVPNNAMKLNQALIEFGGNCNLPAKINEYIYDINLRRTALSLVITHMKFKKDVSNVNFTNLFYLLQDDLPINIRRQISLMLVNVPRGSINVHFTNQSDSLIISTAFHTYPLIKKHYAKALQYLFNKNEAICTRAFALEFIINYIIQNDSFTIENDFSTLYLENQQFENEENIFTFQLLRALSIPQIRNQLLSYEDYILLFIKGNYSSIFTNCALLSLIGFEFTNPKIANLITILSKNSCYLHNVLLILSHLSPKTLQLFSPKIISNICHNIHSDDIYLELTCINHILLAGIDFPNKSISELLSVYKLILDTSPLHIVLCQAFSKSKECKIAALQSGFLNLVRNELVMYGENYSRFKIIWETLSCFVYDFAEGQNSLLDLWSIETLSEFFDTSNTMLQFYLCYTYKNEITQESFSNLLVDKVLNEFDKTRVSPPLLLKLIASILNSQKIRKILYHQKRVQRFLQRLNYAVSHQDWSLCESMLYIVYTLCCYDDGCEELFDKTRIIDIFLMLLSNENVIKIPIFWAVIQKLRKNKIIWKALTYVTRRNNIELLDRLNQIGESCICHRKM